MASKRVAYGMTSLMYAALLGLMLTNRMAAGTSAAPQRAGVMAPQRREAAAVVAVQTSTPEWPGLVEPFVTSFAPQAGQADRPVEQTRKNIQVLKGLPESQLFLLMNFIGASLDVRCDYCHVKNEGKNPLTGGDNWVWESDDKPPKLIARRMMKMVLDINRANFDGEAVVTCYSCHRGGTAVARVPPLPPHDPVQRAAALPTAEQILARYVAAVGGRDAASKFKTTVLKGTLERSQGRNAQVEIKLKAPDKYLVTATTPQGVTTQGVSGEVGWVRSKDGSRKLGERELARLRQAAALLSVVKVTEQPAQMRVLGTERIGDREAYVVAFGVDANTTRSFFFDTQTGLLLRELTTTRTMLAPLPDQVDFEDYRDVDGVKLPFTIRTSNTATYDTATRRFTEIRHDVTIDDAAFDMTAAPR